MDGPTQISAAHIFSSKVRSSLLLMLISFQLVDVGASGASSLHFNMWGVHSYIRNYYG